MEFYDGVKESVKEEHGGKQDKEAQKQEEDDEEMPFDQLKKEAEETETTEDAENTGTQIEVLTEDGIAPMEDENTAADTSPTDETEDRAADQVAQTVQEPTSSPAETEQQPDDVVEVLKRIEQQNAEITDLLRGIKRSLDR